MFLKSTLFLQKLKNFKNNVALFWRLSRRSSKSHATTASSRVNFGNLFVSERSSCEGYTEIFAAQLAIPSRVDLPVAKNTYKFFFSILSLWVLAACPGDLLATHFSHEKRVFCVSKTVSLNFFNFSLEFL